tara:strand:+ start:3222 stop:3587 length:366 start_codon:yes stop_codon:yes gene_type:complete
MIWEIIAAAVPMVIAAGAVYLKSKLSNHSKAISAIEVGVLHAWQTFGRERKEQIQKEFDDPQNSRVSSKFSPLDKANLRSAALTKAVDVMTDLGGRDLASVINPSLWSLEIEKAVRRVKNK